MTGKLSAEQNFQQEKPADIPPVFYLR